MRFKLSPTRLSLVNFLGTFSTSRNEVAFEKKKIALGLNTNNVLQLTLNRMLSDSSQSTLLNVSCLNFLLALIAIKKIKKSILGGEFFSYSFIRVFPQIRGFLLVFSCWTILIRLFSWDAKFQGQKIAPKDLILKHSNLRLTFLRGTIF